MKKQSLFLACFGLTAAMLSTSSFSCNDASAVGTLKTNTYFVEVYSSDMGPLYTVKNTDGVVVGRRLNSDGIAQSFPELSELVESNASYDAGLGPHYDQTSSEQENLLQ